MPLPITSLYTALCLLIALALILWIIGARRTGKVGVGDGGDDELIRRMRSQANFIETAPLMLIAIGLMELNGAPDWLLHGFGVVLVIARAVHPIGMTNRYPNFPFRVGSTLATILSIVAAAFVLGFQAVAA